ncbi:MAG: LUD domain-containing protein [Pseudomonadota bacterium]
MTARDRILTRVRRATQADAQPQVSEEPQRPVPARGMRSGTSALEQFIVEAEKVHATTSRLDSLDDLPAALAVELRDRNLPAAIRTGDDPSFDRDWGTVERSTGPGRIAEPATMTRAIAGSAETGSLVFASGKTNPVTLNYLGETHFAVVDATDIHGGFEGAMEAVRAKGLDSRTVNFVTGPSRSADIGQVLQLGAHGPVALHIFIVGSA